MFRRIHMSIKVDVATTRGWRPRRDEVDDKIIFITTVFPCGPNKGRLDGPTKTAVAFRIFTLEEV